MTWPGIDPNIAAQIGGSLFRFEHKGKFLQASRASDEALKKTAPNTPEYVSSLLTCGWLAAMRGDAQRALGIAREVQCIAQHDIALKGSAAALGKIAVQDAYNLLPGRAACDSLQVSVQWRSLVTTKEFDRPLGDWRSVCSNEIARYANVL